MEHPWKFLETSLKYLWNSLWSSFKYSWNPLKSPSKYHLILLETPLKLSWNTLGTFFKHSWNRLKGKVGEKRKFLWDKSITTLDDQHRSIIIVLPWLIENCIATVGAVLLAPGEGIDLSWYRNWVFSLEELIWAVLGIESSSVRNWLLPI